jgi:hypothetical protein
MIPQTFDQWKHCITVDCKINLTKDFVLQRLTVFQDTNNPETKKFESLYGKEYLQNIIHWFKKMANE